MNYQTRLGAMAIHVPKILQGVVRRLMEFPHMRLNHPIVTLQLTLVTLKTWRQCSFWLLTDPKTFQIPWGWTTWDSPSAMVESLLRWWASSEVARARNRWGYDSMVFFFSNQWSINMGRLGDGTKNLPKLGDDTDFCWLVSQWSVLDT